ncbi:MAG: N-acetylmuramidase family protein [Lewinellaceae bacterium]|nr:N-acetylmuramidase family protein [Lewinellaceae bacterium]
MIKLNSSGPEVRRVQQLLNLLGYNIVEDGRYGPGMLAAVQKFQTQAGLAADGVVGSGTETALLEATKTQRQASEAKLLKMEDLHAAAAKVGVAPEALMAVRDVESRGTGFLPDGKVVILFEGHVLWNKLRKSNIDPSPFAAGNDDILYPKYIPQNPTYKMDQHTRLQKASALRIPGVDARSLAIQSASWGMFQIMGFHYGSLGFSSAEDFYNAMNRSEADQFDIFLRFLEKNNLIAPLKQLNWAAFARAYNGESYATNKYDVRLAQFYNKHLGVESFGDEPEAEEEFFVRPMGVDAEYF